MFPKSLGYPLVFEFFVSEEKKKMRCVKVVINYCSNPFSLIFMNTKGTRETSNSLRTDFCTHRALDFLQILYWK